MFKSRQESSALFASWKMWSSATRPLPLPPYHCAWFKGHARYNVCAREYTHRYYRGTGLETAHVSAYKRYNARMPSALRSRRAKFLPRSGNARKRDRFREAAVTSGDVLSVFRQQRNFVKVSYSIAVKIYNYSYLQIRWIRVHASCDIRRANVSCS